MKDPAVSSTNERYWLAGGKKPVPTLTVAGARFAVEHSRLLDFVLLFSEARIRRLRSLVEKGPKKQSQTPSSDGDPVAKEAREFLWELDSHEELIHEVVLTRVVDNFLCFITDLLALIYKAKPEMLKSSEQERLDFVFQYSDMDELRTAIAEKRVERLAYLGLRELAEYIKSHMAFDLFPVPADLGKASLIVEFRNVIVHNRGRISAASVRRFPFLKPEIGRRVDLPYDQLRESRQFLENAVLDIDMRATGKFFLKAEPLPEPPPELIG
jgi:hypothetical protein